ncbi:MAG: glycerophosphodiester phosphodiesterase, partial [Calditrichaeota bacterium]
MKIYAHRGSSTLWPENTLLAFEKAHESGATGFETDLRLSADGVIVLSHDDNLRRFGHPDKTVSRLAASEIEQIVIPSPDG